MICGFLVVLVGVDLRRSFLSFLRPVCPFGGKKDLPRFVFRRRLNFAIFLIGLLGLWLTAGDFWVIFVLVTTL